MYNAHTQSRQQIGYNGRRTRLAGNTRRQTLSLLRLLTTGSAVMLLAGCSIGNSVDYDSTSQRQVQSQQIQQWKGCIDREMAALLLDGDSPGVAYENTQVRCQGERRDVLASYPLRLKQPVGDMLTEHLQQRTAGHIVHTALSR